MLGRLVTQERLEEGLFASSSDDAECGCQSCGVLLLICSAWMIAYAEGNLVYQSLAVAEARGAATLSCDADPFTAPVGQVFHLEGCYVQGALNWMDVAPDLLSGFQKNIVDKKDLDGVRFQSEVKMYSRRRSASWDYVDATANLYSTDLVPNGDVHVGSFRVSEDVKSVFPTRQVGLQPDLYFDGSGIFGRCSPQSPGYSSWSTPDVLDSSNMCVHGDALYYTCDVYSACSDDVKISFFVATEKVVSTLTTADTHQTLVPWASSQETKNAWIFSGYTLDLVDTGAVSTDAQLDDALSQVESGAWQIRIDLFFVTLVGIFFLVFAADALDCCCRRDRGAGPRRRSADHNCKACGSSVIISAILQVLLSGVAFFAFSSVPKLLIVCALLAGIYSWRAGAFDDMLERFRRQPAPIEAQAGYLRVEQDGTLPSSGLEAGQQPAEAWGAAQEEAQQAPGQGRATLQSGLALGLVVGASAVVVFVILTFFAMMIG